jgi:alanine racemase
MDWLMVNLGVRNTVKIGDDVLLIGKEGGNNLGADKISKIVKSIPYEVICSMADRVQRVYV